MSSGLNIAKDVGWYRLSTSVWYLLFWYSPILKRICQARFRLADDDSTYYYTEFSDEPRKKSIGINNEIVNATTTILDRQELTPY